jgi:hypothetical protein
VFFIGEATNKRFRNDSFKNQNAKKPMLENRELPPLLTNQNILNHLGASSSKKNAPRQMNMRL